MVQTEIVRLIIIVLDISAGCALLMSMVLFAQIREMNVFWRLAIWTGAVGLLASAQLQIAVLNDASVQSVVFLGLPVWVFKDVGYWLFAAGLYYFEIRRRTKPV